MVAVDLCEYQHHRLGGWPLAASPEGVSAAMPATASTAPDRVSLEEYFALPDVEGPLREWVAGKVVVHELPTSRHQRLALFLTVLLELFVNLRGAGRVFPAGYPTLLTPEGPVREPDIVFVAAQHLHRIRAQRLEGPADLAVEIVSDDSVGRDRAEKFDQYQQAGVREYWVIDPRPGRERADFWVLDEADGRYRAVVVGADGIYRATVLPGFWVQTEWLRPDSAPDPLFAFAEVAALPGPVVEALRAAQARRPGDT